MFVDEVLIKLIAGKGGDGCTSFRREKFVAMGGPNGGNGGRGANIIFKTDKSLKTLIDLKVKKIIKGEKGVNGKGSDQNGANALDVVIMAIGNMIGAAIIGLLFNLVCPFSYEQLNGFIAGKVLAEDMSNWYIPLIRGVFAGFFVFIAVLLYKKVENPVVKALGILLSIAVMVLVGADHSVANCFYFFAAMKGINVAWYNVLVSLLMAVVGNIIGAWFLWVLYHFATKKAQNEEKNL